MNSEPAKIYGIDLGTTRSSIAHVDISGRPVAIENLDNRTTTPSIVYFRGDEIIVGEHAKNVSRLYSNDVCVGIKRSMGTDEEFIYAGKSYRPEEISSFILTKVVNDAQQMEGTDITDVVITCPAYFNEKERNATQQAGVWAGLNVVGILNEPVAAAFAYGKRTDKAGNVLVYDLGGGTFDVTVVNIEDDKFREIVTAGVRRLGGSEQWDGAIVQYLAEAWQQEFGFGDNPLDDANVLQDLYLKAEQHKEKLTNSYDTNVIVEYKGHIKEVHLTRDKFDELTAHLLQQTIDLTHSVLNQAREKGFPVDEILLVGGSSKMPQVKERIEKEFGIDAKLSRPDLAVAEGAALYAHDQFIKKVHIEISRYITNPDDVNREVAAKLGLTTDYVVKALNTEVITITSHSFGIQAIVNDGSKKELKIVNLIIKGTELPAEVIRSDFSPEQDNQSTVNIVVVENTAETEYVELDHGTKINDDPTELLLELPPGTPASDPIEVTFGLDRSGILDVSARLLRTGAIVKAQFSTGRTMSQEDLDDRRKQLRGIKVK